MLGTTASTGFVIVMDCVFFFFLVFLLFWGLFLLLAFFWLFFFFLFDFLLLFFAHTFLQRRQIKPLRRLLNLLLIFKVPITYKLLLGQFHNFLLVHTSNMQSLGTSHALQYRHCISTDPTFITIMERASKMEGIGVDILEVLLARVGLNAFWMEVFWAVCRWAFCYLVFFLVFWGYLFLLCWFAFAFLGFLVLDSVVISFLFADEAGDDITFAIIASKVHFHGLFQGLFIKAQLLDINFTLNFLEWGNILFFYLFPAFNMENPFAEALTVIGTFRMLTKETKFFEHFIFFLLIRYFLFIISAFLYIIFFSFLVDKYVAAIFWLWPGINCLLICFTFCLKILVQGGFLKSSWWFADFLQPDTRNFSVLFLELSLRVNQGKELT